jgi:hypothetical protein
MSRCPGSTVAYRIADIRRSGLFKFTRISRRDRMHRRYVLNTIVIAGLLGFVVTAAISLGGNIFNVDLLAGQAWLVGAGAGGLGAFVFGRNHLQWIPEIAKPSARLIVFCIQISASIGFLVSALALTANRFVVPEQPQVWWMHVVKAGKSRGGWSVDFAREAGETYQQYFVGEFCPNRQGETFRFEVRMGILGYPFYVKHDCGLGAPG